MAAGFLAISPGHFQNLRRLALFLAMLMSGGNPIFPRIPLLIAVLVLCLACKGPTLGIRREMGLIGIVLLAVFGVAVIGAENVDFLSLATRYANFIVGLTLLGLYLTEPRDTFSSDVVPIFRGMGLQIIATIGTWFIAPQLFSIHPVNDVMYYTVFWVLTYHGSVLNDTSIIRPDGFFWEPGVFQIYMNIYLFIALFVKRSRPDMLLALFGLLLLQSTTGLLTAMIIIVVAAIQGFHKTSAGMRVLGLVLAPFVAVPLILIAADNFSNKTSGILRGSSWARAYDFHTGVNVIKAHPLVGLGFDYERYRLEANRLGYTESQLDYRSTVDRQNSNGIITLLVSIGIPMSLPFLVAIFRQRFFRKQILFGVLLTLSFFNEAVMLTPFFLMLMFSAMLLRGKVDAGSRRQSPLRSAGADRPARPIVTTASP